MFKNPPAVRERWSRKAMVFAGGIVLIAVIVVAFILMGHPNV